MPVLVQPHAVSGFPQDVGQRGLPLDGLAAQFRQK